MPTPDGRQTAGEVHHTFSAITRAIRVSVRPDYLEDQSSPEEGRFLWAYHIQIENLGETTVQLRNRYWRITDATGTMHEVRGPGVVGLEPVIGPGEVFEYTSGAPLSTPSGIMVGSYEMELPGGERFDVAIPAFSLDVPDMRRTLN